MWMRRFPYWATHLCLVLVLATTDFTNGAKPPPSLDIQVKLISDGTSQNTQIYNITICLMETEEQAKDSAEDYLLTLTNSTGTTIRGDKLDLQNQEDVCFTLPADYSEFNLEEQIDITVYKIVPDDHKGRRKYKLLTENTVLLAPKVDVISEDLVLVQWNNPDDVQLFYLSVDTDESSPTLCKSQTCQFIIENPNHQNYMNLLIQSEDEKQLHQTAEIDINVEKGGESFKKPTQLTRIKSIRQSINYTTGIPFMTVQIEAKGIQAVDCLHTIISYGNITQTGEICKKWDGSAVDISIPHAEFPVEMENIEITIVSTYNNAPIDVSRMKFSTSAFDTTVGIVGSGDTNAFLRIRVGSGEDEVSVDDNICKAGEICHYPYSDEQSITERQKPIQVEVDGSDDTYDIIQYDDSIMPFINLDGLAEVKLLNEEKLDIATDYSSLDNSIKVFIFDLNYKTNNEEELECFVENIKDTISCSVKLDFSMTGIEQLNMVVMMLNPDQKVIKSTLVALDDLKIQVERFTLSSLKVTWNGNSEEHYLLDIEPVPNSYTYLRTMCTSQVENCLAFFTDVKIEEGYTLSVKKEGSKTKVARTINTDKPGTLNEVKILKIIESKGCTKLEVDLSKDVQVEVAVTRVNGSETAKQTIIAAQNVEEGNIYSSNFYTNPEDENVFNNVTELIIIGSNENEIIATSYLRYQYTDIVVDLVSVGNYSGSEGRSLRVTPLNEDQVLYIGDSCYAYGEAFYLIEPETDILEICVDGVDDINTQFKQCDETQEPSKFQEIDTISKLILTDETDLEVSAEFNSSKNYAEILLYDPQNLGIINDAQTCIFDNESDDTTCAIELEDPVPEELLMFNVLVVVVDANQRVLESSLRGFEDLKLNVKNLTRDIVAVNWHHSAGTDNYSVQLAENTKSFMSDLKSSCSTNDTCTAVFSQLKPTEYIFTVQKEGNSLTKVANTYTVSDSGEEPEDITISNVIESNGCTKITLEKKDLPPSLVKLGVSITNTDDSGTSKQTFVPGNKTKEDENSVVYSISFVFDSTKVKENTDDTEMVLVGLDEAENVIASTELSFHYQELSTKISAVGATLEATGHSLRVVLAEGESLQNVDSQTCSVNTACYFIEPENYISACKQEKDDSGLILCNEGSSEFEELSDVSVSFSENGIVQVSTMLSEEDHLLEVVVYDENKPHNILSKDNKYDCARNQIRESEYKCSQETKVTKELKFVWVLVVKINTTDNTVVQSTKQQISFNTGVEEWVIVISSIGGLFAVIFIIFGTLVIWKKQSTKKKDKNIISQDYNTERKYNTNVNPEDDDRYGDDLHMSQLGPQDHYRHDNAYDNPSFNHNQNYNHIDNTQRNTQNRSTGHYAPNNRPNHHNVHARHSNPPLRNDQYRHSARTPSDNTYYNDRIDSDYSSSPYIPATPIAKEEPVYARLNRDTATATALQPAQLGPIPRIYVPPSRAQQYKAITETTAIPPHGNWDIDI